MLIRRLQVGPRPRLRWFPCESHILNYVTLGTWVISNFTAFFAFDLITAPCAWVFQSYWENLWRICIHLLKVKQDQQMTYLIVLTRCFVCVCVFFLIFFLKVDAFQMGIRNICLYKEVDKKYTGCNLNTTELIECALKGVCAVIRSNTVVSFCHLDRLQYKSMEQKKKKKIACLKSIAYIYFMHFLCPKLWKKCWHILVWVYMYRHPSVRQEHWVLYRVLKFHIWIPHGNRFDGHFFLFD